jgi:hypothetical protein
MTTLAPRTLTRFLIEEQRRHANATGNFTRIVHFEEPDGNFEQRQGACEEILRRSERPPPAADPRLRGNGASCC